MYYKTRSSSVNYVPKVAGDVNPPNHLGVIKNISQFYLPNPKVGRSNLQGKSINSITKDDLLWYRLYTQVRNRKRPDIVEIAPEAEGGLGPFGLFSIPNEILGIQTVSGAGSRIQVPCRFPSIQFTKTAVQDLILDAILRTVVYG